MATTQELAIINQGPFFYEFSTNLDGQRFFLEFNYNFRNDTWYMDLKDSDREVLLAGLPCLTDTQLMTSRFALDDVLPVGEIIISDINESGIDPDLENFGDNVSAFYLSISDE